MIGTSLRYTAEAAAALVAGLIAVLPAVTACSSHPRAHAAATSTAVQADEQAAAVLLQSCVTAVHIAQAESCIESKVPPAKRTALKTCLASDAVSALRRTGHVMATFRAGAQPCVQAALK